MISHSLLSASGSSRWKDCALEAVADYVLKKESSAAADRGTKLHDLLAQILSDRTREYDVKNIKQQFDILNTEDKLALRFVVSKFRELFYSKTDVYDIKVENRVFYNKVLGLTDEEAHYAFGTADFSALVKVDFENTLAYMAADDAESMSDELKYYDLYVCDAKFGRWGVESRNNSQLALYAAGILQSLSLQQYEKINSIVMNIVQPGFEMQPWVITIDELYAFLDRYKQSARDAIDIFTRKRPITIEDFPEKPHKFSALRGVYNLRQWEEVRNIDFEEFLRKAQYQLDDAIMRVCEDECVSGGECGCNSSPYPENHPDHPGCIIDEDFPTVERPDLSMKLDLAFKIKEWANDVIEQAEKWMIEYDMNESVAGYYLAEGRQKPLKWDVNADRIAKELSLSDSELYQTELKSPSQIIKDLKNIDPEIEEKIAKITTRDKPNKKLTKWKEE